ncbi:hypothetical protein [Actinoplanes sp. NPDC026623]|uniref:hypothetical protein n=1 Tax=Actinoplanes sp. NPDC026623 TaxID=3155610 RepID=UPI0033E6CB15
MAVNPYSSLVPRLEIMVNGSDLVDDDLAFAARALRSELLNLDVDDVNFPDGGAPEPGAKSAALAAAGLMLVSTAPAVIPAVIDVALGWLKRQPLDVHLEIDGQVLTARVTREQRDALVAAYLQRATRDASKA